MSLTDTSLARCASKRPLPFHALPERMTGVKSWWPLGFLLADVPAVVFVMQMAGAYAKRTNNKNKRNQIKIVLTLQRLWHSLLLSMWHC